MRGRVGRCGELGGGCRVQTARTGTLTPNRVDGLSGCGSGGARRGWTSEVDCVGDGGAVWIREVAARGG